MRFVRGVKGGVCLGPTGVLASEMPSASRRPGRSGPLSLLVDRQPSRAVELRCWQHDRSGRYGSGRAAHPGFEISWVESGRLTYVVGRRQIELGRGDGILVPPEVEHETDFVGPTQGRSLKLAGELFGRVIGAVGASGSSVGGDARLEPGPLSSRATALAQLLYRQALVPTEVDRAAGVDRALAVEAIAESLVLELLQRRREQADGRAPNGDPRVARARRLIEQRYAEPLTIDELAAVAGMSRYHFSRRFHAATGKSPYRYLVQIRLERAAALLRAGQHNVTQAAMAVGFSEIGRFCRVFRDYAGCTPGEYLRRGG